MTKRLRKQIHSRTFKAACVAVVGEGSKTFADSPIMWWIGGIVFLGALLALGLFGEDATQDDKSSDN